MRMSRELSPGQRALLAELLTRELRTAAGAAAATPETADNFWALVEQRRLALRAERLRVDPAHDPATDLARVEGLPDAVDLADDADLADAIDLTDDGEHHGDQAGHLGAVREQGA